MNNIISEKQIDELINIYDRFGKYLKVPPKKEGNWIIETGGRSNKDALFSSVVFAILSIQEDFSKLCHVHGELYKKYGDGKENILHFEECKRKIDEFREDLKRLFKEYKIGRLKENKPKWVVGSISTLDMKGEQIIDSINRENYAEATELIREIDGLDVKSWFVLQRLNCKVLSIDSHIKNQLEKIGVKNIEGISANPKEWMKFISAIRQKFEFKMIGNYWNNYAALDLILWYKDKIEKFLKGVDKEAYPLLKEMLIERSS